ncbi:Ctr-domain-containing protein [Auriculariales sp. MPI-PUGE-AT-0066]|nr:Ctr-domain-containing protein [Auriculariales sp. MPI-PUGE-AT-0066]
MDMSMDMSSTTTSMDAMATGMSSSMDDEMDMGGGCKISMLWNWNTVDTCFISTDWHIKSKGMFAGSVIGIFLLVILIELTRRFAREYDRRIARQAATTLAHNGDISTLEKSSGAGPVNIRPTVAQQAVRATLYMVQFSAGYMLMLLAMYYNGYILIFGIFFGAWAGFFLTSWDTVAHGESTAKDCCS